MNRQKGYIHIYYGSGKGKTTAALGLSLRTLLSGGTVFFAQFFKGMETAETDLTSLCDRFVLQQYGTGKYISGEPDDEDRKQAMMGLNHCQSVIRSDTFDLVVLDELMLSVYFMLIPVEDIVALLSSRNPRIEVVLTGRRAPSELVGLADLVTEMRKVKHYFDTGVSARKGIEF